MKSLTTITIRRWPTAGFFLLLAAWVAAFPAGAMDNHASDPAATASTSPQPFPHSSEDYELLKLFVDTLDQVERNYVKDVSRRELVEAAIQGMLGKLDQHTNYISPKELEHFKTGVESEFGGIGIFVMTRDGELQVTDTVVGSPAHRAGLVSGDVITHVAGKPLKGVAIDDAIQQLKGKAGTSVSFTLRHGKTGKTEELKLAREVVRVETVSGRSRKTDNTWDYWLDPDKKIAYIRISTFARHTADDLRKALDELSSRQMQGLVLDLRFNPGGLLSSAIEVADMFVAEGRIVSTSGRNIDEKHWDAQKRGTYEGFAIAVLVNRASASASEIVAACLQDHKRAVVVGERSWGKGSVQNVVELEGGNSALKLTTAKYFRPSGQDIHRDDQEGEEGEWGVKPDEGLDLRLSLSQLQELAVDFSRRSRLQTENPASPPPLFVDRQLEKALEKLNEELAKTLSRNEHGSSKSREQANK